MNVLITRARVFIFSQVGACSVGHNVIFTTSASLPLQKALHPSVSKIFPRDSTPAKHLLYTRTISAVLYNSSLIMTGFSPFATLKVKSLARVTTTIINCYACQGLKKFLRKNTCGGKTDQDYFHQSSFTPQMMRASSFITRHISRLMVGWLSISFLYSYVQHVIWTWRFSAVE